MFSNFTSIDRRPSTIRKVNWEIKALLEVLSVDYLWLTKFLNDYFHIYSEGK